MKARQMRIVRNIIMIVTVIAGFILWLFIPYQFKNSKFFHVGTGEYGIKPAALILLLLPLFALIPDKGEGEIHTDDPEEREKSAEEHEMREAKRQVVIALFLGITVLSILGIAAFVL